MFQRKPRRFGRNTNGRDNSPHGNGYRQARPRPNSFSNNPRNNFRPTQSAEKLLEKYNTLATEAISSGDRTLGENYFQHADHYMRIIEEKNKIRDQNKANESAKIVIEKNLQPVNEPAKKEDAENRKE
jgi:hypothetical protein